MSTRAQPGMRGGSSRTTLRHAAAAIRTEIPVVTATRPVTNAVQSAFFMYMKVVSFWSAIPRRCGVLALLLALARPAAAETALDVEGRELLGKPAPAWDAGPWFNGPPLALADLRGKVVLVRWFMSTRCPLCSATAPSLERLWTTYRARGLVVVGMYHHKDPEALTADLVAAHVRHFAFTFPVAVDPEWRTLRRWWLDGHDRRFTSVSFLIDRRGVIRAIHAGGRLAPESADYTAMTQRIEALLKQ